MRPLDRADHYRNEAVKCHELATAKNASCGRGPPSKFPVPLGLTLDAVVPWETMLYGECRARRTPTLSLRLLRSRLS
jgi:hypothetical protein